MTGSRYPQGLDPSTQWRGSSRSRRDGFWPDPQEELLLKAVLSSGERATQAIEGWQQAVDIERMSFGSYRLLPMLYRKAADLGVSLDHAGVIGGIYRRSWYRNTILLDKTAAALGALAATDIDAMLLKGAALLTRYYTDRGMRPLGDVDILVRWGQAEQALDVLADLGWEQQRTRRIPALSKAWALRDGSAGAIDLHRTPGREYLAPAAVSGLWERSRPGELGGVPVYLETPEDLLLHVLAHGVAPRGPIHWVADAVVIITQSPGLDWEVFTSHTVERRIAHRVASALEYLERVFDLPMDDNVRKSLGSSAGWERRELSAYRRWLPGSVVWDSAHAWYWYRRRCAIEGQRANPWGFLQVISRESGRSIGHVARAGLGSGWRRVRRGSDGR